MIPFGNQAVTLLHKTEKGYEHHILTGCSWRNSTARTLSGTAVITTVETTCRIPAGQMMPAPGDLIALGIMDISAGGEIELVRILQQLQRENKPAFRVQRVKDNSIGIPMPHYAATGE